MNGTSGARTNKLGVAPRRILLVEIDFRTELKLKSRSRNREKKMADFPRQRHRRADARVVREARQAREEPGEAQSKTRPAKMAGSAPLGFVNPS